MSSPGLHLLRRGPTCSTSIDEGRDGFCESYSSVVTFIAEKACAHSWTSSVGGVNVLSRCTRTRPTLRKRSPDPVTLH